MTVYKVSRNTKEKTEKRSNTKTNIAHHLFVMMYYCKLELDRLYVNVRNQIDGFALILIYYLGINLSCLYVGVAH